MHKIVYKIHEFLEKAATGNSIVDEQLLEQFGESCKAALRKQLTPDKKGFRLRMSNVGRPLRQLMLEKLYGRRAVSPDFMLKMLFGDLYESLMIFLIKASGINVTELNTSVTIPFETAKGTVNLDGTLDIGIDINDEDGIYDVKSASPYSFENKFDGTAILTDDDSFGYVDQLFAYAKAVGKKAKGWIVVNKVDGQIKVCEIPKDKHDELIAKSVERIKEKICYIEEGKPIPPCTGEVAETYYGKSSGNFILGPSCRFCDHKEICHPNIQYKPSLVSKSSNPKWQFYTKLNKKGDSDA